MQYNHPYALKIGTRLHDDTYEIIRVQGQGGFGITYEARNLLLDRRVAIKEFFMESACGRGDDGKTVVVPLLPLKEQFEAQRNKFIGEAKKMAKMRNKHLVTVHAFFNENGTSYIDMDYVEGQSLRGWLNNNQQLLDEDTVRLVVLNQMLEALECIHNQKPPLCHLDIKPENIMVDSDGENIVLIDFGASKYASNKGGLMSSTVIYTPGYAPSEQIESNIEKMGPWTDFYALGATMFTMLTGDKPSGPSEIMDDPSPTKENTIPLPTDLSDQMKELILWMMKPNKAERPQSVQEIREFLDGSQFSSTQIKTISYSVVLSEVGANDLQVANALNTLCGISFKEAKELVDGAPSILKKDIDQKTAERIRDAMMNLGAVVSIVKNEEVDGLLADLKRRAREAEEAKRRAEEAKHKAEEEAKRRAEEAKRRAEAEAIRKAKEAEEVKRKSEEEARRRAREAEEAERRRKEEEKRHQAEEAERRRLEEEKNRKEAAAWNALQSCSNEDIEKYGISIISFARGKKPTIYYRGYSFICQEEITKIKNHLDVKNFLILFAEKGGKGILEVKDYKRKDFDTYYKENSKTLAEAENLITFCSKSDLLRILRKREHLHKRRIAQEMQLIPLCFDSNKDSAYSIEYQNLFCDAEIGGGVHEILQAGFIGDHREPIDSDFELISKKLSAFEVFSHLLLGATVQYKILSKEGFDDTTLLTVFPFDVNAEEWVNGRYRDFIILIEGQTTIPCKESKTIIDDNCSSIILSFLGKRFALDIPKLFGYIPKSFEITFDVDAGLGIKFDLKDKEWKKEISIRRDELFDYEES